jgi:hypothetical protein
MRTCPSFDNFKVGDGDSPSHGHGDLTD